MKKLFFLILFLFSTFATLNAQEVGQKLTGKIDSTHKKGNPPLDPTMAVEGGLPPTIFLPLNNVSLNQSQVSKIMDILDDPRKVWLLQSGDATLVYTRVLVLGSSKDATATREEIWLFVLSGKDDAWRLAGGGGYFKTEQLQQIPIPDELAHKDVVVSEEDGEIKILYK
jgi:hypothetical protein